MMREKISKFSYSVRYGKIISKKNLDAYLSPKYTLEDYRSQKFNSIWENAHKQYAIYSDLKKEYSLPSKIADLEELSDFPILDKDRLRFYADSILQESKVNSSMSSGGSSGLPLIFPVDHRNARRSIINASLGRYANEIMPWDRSVVVWGHSHLLPKKGFRKIIAKSSRQYADFLTNTIRLNAYDLSDKALESIVEEIVKFKPKVLISYSSVIRALLSKYKNIANFPKKIIATSEQVFKSDYKLASKAGVELISEYGLAEFGAVAYTLPGKKCFTPFYNSFYTQIGDQDDLLITDLDETAFPFINYSSGDLVANAKGSLKCLEIKGRANDNLVLPIIGNKKRKVHSEFFTHIIKSCTLNRFNVMSINGTNNEDELPKLVVSFDCQNNMINTIKESVLKLFLKEIPDLETKRIQFNNDYKRRTTLAGKEKFIFSGPDRAI